MNLGKINEFTAPIHNNHSKTATEASQKKASTLVADNLENKDRVEKDTPYYTPAYTKASAKSSNSSNNISIGEAGKSVKHIKNEAMKNMVANTLSGQASGGKGSIGAYIPLSNHVLISDALKAAEATSVGKDYWGVEATAERIFTFAKTLAGDDLKALDKMRAAFDKGFNQALGARKGNLPSISYQTRDKVYEMFDNYAKELQNKKETPAVEADK